MVYTLSMRWLYGVQNCVDRNASTWSIETRIRRHFLFIKWIKIIFVVYEIYEIVSCSLFSILPLHCSRTRQYSVRILCIHTYSALSMRCTIIIPLIFVVDCGGNPFFLSFPFIYLFFFFHLFCLLLPPQTVWLYMRGFFFNNLVRYLHFFSVSSCYYCCCSMCAFSSSSGSVQQCEAHYLTPTRHLLTITQQAFVHLIIKCIKLHKWTVCMVLYVLYYRWMDRQTVVCIE